MKFAFKKFLIFCVAALLAFTFCACSSTAPLPPNNGGNGGNTPSDPSSPTTPDDDPDKDAFTVRLVGNNFIIPPEELKEISESGVEAVWTDLSSVNNASRSAKFDLDGIARLEDLDGDYRVTLSGALANYTYNPNIYTVNNANKSVEITLYSLHSLKGQGKGTGFTNGDVIQIDSTGFYRVELNAMNYSDGVRFMFSAKDVGEYSFESFVDVTANKINPILQTFTGTFAYVNESSPRTVNGGGKEGSFTKNFRYSFEIGTSAVTPFLVKAAKTDEAQFPLYIDFLLDKDGEYSGGNNKEEAVPKHDFEAAKDTAFSDTTGKSFRAISVGGGTYPYNYTYYSAKYVTLGSDGYYYLKNPETNAIGSRLYAKITRDTTPVSTDTGSGFLDPKFGGQLTAGGKNYKYFIKGKPLTTDEAGNTLTYEYKGYAQYVNGDGVYPVTEELKEFLQVFCVGRGYFNDGNGTLEGYGYNSSNDAQWLFACGYYA